jgi:hypothetical protein
LPSENPPLTPFGKIKSKSASEPSGRVSATWKKIQGKQWNIRLRNSALQMHLMGQNIVSYGTVLIMAALI